MKKIYIRPMATVYRVNMEHSLLAGSAQGTDVFTGSPASTENEVLSRRTSSLWDDEDEEY